MFLQVFHIAWEESTKLRNCEQVAASGRGKLTANWKGEQVIIIS